MFEGKYYLYKQLSYQEDDQRCEMTKIASPNLYIHHSCPWPPLLSSSMVASNKFQFFLFVDRLCILSLLRCSASCDLHYILSSPHYCASRDCRCILSSPHRNTSRRPPLHHLIASLLSPLDEGQAFPIHSALMIDDEVRLTSLSESLI